MAHRTIVALLLFSGSAFADVRLPKVLQSHMVLQQQSDVKIRGWAEPTEVVTVVASWNKTPVTTETSPDGTWQVELKTIEAGGPHSITISGTNAIVLDDVLFGEVWLASGQSNMEMPLMKVSGAYTGVKDYAQEIAAADHPTIRLFQAGNFSSKEPLEDVGSGISMYGIPAAKCEWQICTPKTIPHFASTAYFFARELNQKLGVPVGIIDASWGGTPAEAWTPRSGLEKLSYTAELSQADNLPQKADAKIPTRLYNGMIHPLRHVSIKGAIWYQGEGNAGRANKYRELFSTMITEWRRAFEAEFPFYFVQIAPYQYRGVNAAYLRESQLQTLTLPKTGMAVTMDIGHQTDIHPKNKQEVGRRLALWALAKDYGQDLSHSGPVYRSVLFEDDTARLSFDHASGGLGTSNGEPPSHFEIAGDDQVFHTAIATIDGEHLIVSSPDVAHPQAVRYAFASNAMPNLTNAAGLPASSFRTDRWAPK